MTQRKARDFRSIHRQAYIWEYRFYFTLIFLIGLVPATIHCFLARIGVLKRNEPWNGILRCAWSKAQAYTPMIFSA
jgi:hypothetical protein